MSNTTKQMSVGQVEPVTMEWLKDNVPSPPPPGLAAVMLTIADPTVAKLEPENLALVLQPNARPLSIRALAPGKTSISCGAITGPPGVPVPLIWLDGVELTVVESPEVYEGRVKIG